jgi:DNA gyrase subunit A
MKAGDVRVIGRATQGVRLIEMEEGDQVVAIAKLLERDDEPANGSAPPGSDPSAPVAISDSTPESTETLSGDETPDE